MEPTWVCPGVDRERVVDMHNGILFSHKKRKIVIYRKMYATGNYEIKSVRPQKDKGSMFSLICGFWV